MSDPFRPGPRARTVLDADDHVHEVPADWSLLPPGDPGVTRRVKAAGPHWVVEEKRGRKRFGRGVWAPTATITKVQADLEAERSTESYARKRAADQDRREREQHRYEGAFERAVLAFLHFHPDHAELAAELARRITVHATPVGSGTVARTERIPVDERAEAATIAWMRHQTTAYDQLHVPRVKGARRAVRRQLAEQSRKVLDSYRRGEPAPANCPLQRALTTPAPARAPEGAPKEAPPAPPKPTGPGRAALFARLKKQVGP